MSEQVEKSAEEIKAEKAAERAEAKAKKEAEKAERKAAKEAEKAAKKAAKEANKGQRGKLAGSLIKVLVDADNTALRVGSIRHALLAVLGAQDSVYNTKDVLNQPVQAGEKVVKLSSTKILGMYARKHIALSYDNGATWQLSTEAVQESAE